MKKLYILITIALISSDWASAQINIDKNDMPLSGQIYPKYTFIDGSATNYATSGANFIWNFSNLISTTISGDTFVSVTSAPLVYNISFNSPFDTLHKATVASPQAANSPIATIQMTDVYNFFKVSNSRYTQVGFGAAINGVPMPLKYDFPDVWYNFPLILGDVDSSVSSYSLNIPNLGFFAETKHRHNTVDGWGTLILPHDTFNVMRIKSDLFISDTIFVDTFGIGYRLNRTETEYKWLTKQKGIPVLKVVSRTGTKTVEYFDTTLYSLGISENNISRLDVFPNPVQNEIFISSTEPINFIEIINQNGQIVYSDKFFDLELQKRISISSLSDGIYILKCYNMGKPSIKKLVKIN